MTCPSFYFIQIIHKVNLKFNEFLDEGNYSIPRLATGYKGDHLPVFKVPQLRSASPATVNSAGVAALPPASASNNSSTQSMTANGTSNTNGNTNGNGNGTRPAGIASVWAATEPFDVSQIQRRSPSPTMSAAAPDGHQAPSRRGSENAMNDTDSVVSDITAASTAQHNTLHSKAPAARRSSLNVLLGKHCVHCMLFVML